MNFILLSEKIISGMSFYTVVEGVGQFINLNFLKSELPSGGYNSSELKVWFAETNITEYVKYTNYYLRPLLDQSTLLYEEEVEK